MRASPLSQQVRQVPSVLAQVVEWLRGQVSRALRAGAFAHLDDARLVDHHWAAKSAYRRALRTGQTRAAQDLALLLQSLREEMRRRGLR